MGSHWDILNRENLTHLLKVLFWCCVEKTVGDLGRNFEGGKKLFDLGHILKANIAGFGDRLNVGCEKTVK